MAGGEGGALTGVEEGLLPAQLERLAGTVASIPLAAATESSVPVSAARGPLSPKALIVSQAPLLCKSTSLRYSSMERTHPNGPLKPPTRSTTTTS